MDKKFLIKLGIKNLLAHRMRTVLTLSGVIIGISAVVFLVSFGSGIQKLVTDQISGGNAFQLIDVGTGNSQIVKLDEATISKIAAINGVSSVKTITNLGAKIKKNDNSMDTTLFATDSVYIGWLGKKVRYGDFVDENDNNGILVNSSLAEFLVGADQNSAIDQKSVFDVLIPKELSPTGEAITVSGKEYTIKGIIKDDSSPSAYLNTKVSTDLGVNLYSQAKVYVSNQSEVSEIRKKIEAFGLKTEYVGDTVNQVQQVFSIFKIILGSFGFIALLVALLGMFNTLTISLLERMKEVALMKILGMRKKEIRSIFMFEALFLGVTGGIIGIIWGVILGKIVNIIFNSFAIRSGADGVTVFYYPFSLILLIFSISIIVGLVTGIYPARRAEKVDALDILRYE